MSSAQHDSDTMVHVAARPADKDSPRGSAETIAEHAHEPTADEKRARATEGEGEAGGEGEGDMFDRLEGFTASADEPDVYLVDWDGPHDPANPKNWSFRKKWIATAVVSCFTFISPVSSSMVAPASPQVAAEFGVTNDVVIAMMTSVFVLGYAFGPLVLGPLSELFGRSRVLQLANMWYFAWNLGCGFAQNKGQLIGFRFLAGLGGSAPLSVGGGVLGDVWHAEQRGQAIAVYSLAPLLGPVIGPIAGGWIAERSTWRWVFWSTTIVDGAIQLFGLFYLKETYAPILLERKAFRMRAELGLNADIRTSRGVSHSKVADPEKGRRVMIKTVFSSGREWQAIVRKALFRPFILWVQEPIVQLLGVYMAFVYGLMYLFITTLPGIFEGVYHERVGIAGLHYLALGVGLTGASQANARLLDRIYKHLKEKNGGVGKPEFRLPSMFPATVFLPVGLLITGWTARRSVFWIVPDIGIAFVGAGVILTFQSITTYIIDAFTLHAASALAAATFLRSIAGFGFPLFAPAMFNALGYGKGDTILAAVAIAVGGPAPWLFWHYGERIRQSSRYATK